MAESRWPVLPRAGRCAGGPRRWHIRLRGGGKSITALSAFRPAAADLPKPRDGARRLDGHGDLDGRSSFRLQERTVYTGARAPLSTEISRLGGDAGSSPVSTRSSRANTAA